MPWHVRHAYGTTSHQNTPFDTSGTAHLQVARGTSYEPAQVWMHHTDPTGKNVIHSVSLHDSGRVSVYADGQTHELATPADTSQIRSLVDAHHTNPQSWPAVLDSLVEHPDIGPLVSDAVDAHVAARYGD